MMTLEGAKPSNPEQSQVGIDAAPLAPAGGAATRGLPSRSERCGARSDQATKALLDVSSKLDHGLVVGTEECHLALTDDQPRDLDLTVDLLPTAEVENLGCRVL